MNTPIANHETGLVARQLTVEQYLGRLGHAADGTRGKVSQMSNRPGILIFRDHGATIRSMQQHTKEELGIRFGAVNPNAGQESVEVVVHALAVLRRNDCELTASDTRLFLHLHGFVVISDPTLGAHTTPVAQNGVPHCDMLHIWVALSYLSCKGFKTVGEPFLVGFKVGPRELELRLASGQGLPVVVDDEIGDVDVFF